MGRIGYHNEALCHHAGIIIGRKGAYRGVHYSDGAFFVIDTAFYLKLKNSKAVNLRWAYYQLRDFDINQLDSGSAIPSTSREAFYRYPLNFHRCRCKKRIAAILSAYNDLIENNTRRIKVLEEMAQMIYREWLINFRFPGHEKVKMVESEVGLIPEDFCVEDMGNVVGFENGKASEIGKQGPFPLYGSNGVIGRSTVAKYQNAVIIGRVGAYCGSTMYCGGSFWASDNTIVAYPARGKNLCVEFVYFLLQSMNLRRYAGGSAQPLLTQNVLRRLRCVVPDEKINSQFHDIFAPLLTLIINLRTQADNLRQTRDLLIPKLISGEVNVEQIGAEAVAQGV